MTDEINNQVSEIQNWWNNGEGQDIAGQIAALDTDITGHQSDIEDLQGLKAGYNPFKFMKNAWVKATQVPPIEDKIDQANKEKQILNARLEQAANDQAEKLFAGLLLNGDEDLRETLDSNRARKADVKQVSQALSTIKERSDNVIAVINRAWKECDEAQDYETFDMVASGPLATIISDGETREAADHLKKVEKALDEYKDFMEQAKSSYKNANVDLDIEGLLDIADWDLWMGLFDIDVLSFFSSWENHEKLGKAKTQLEEIKEVITPVSNSVKNELESFACEIDELDASYATLRAESLSALDLPAAMSAIIQPANDNVVKANITPTNAPR